MSDLYEEIFGAIEKGTLESLDTATRAVLEVLEEKHLVKASDLMGLGDLAEFFSVGVSTVGNWRDRRDRTGMPEPVATLSNGPVWDGAQVVAWWTAWVPGRGAHKVGSLPWERE